MGDGHIDKRPDQPIYIESHSEGEKDYLFWKYKELKDLCNSEPKYHKEAFYNFGTDKEYLCQPFYRFETRIINQLKEIREMSRYDKINQLNEFGLCLHVLDDGYRGDVWELCLAEYTEEEINLYIRLCKQRLDLICLQKKDDRYISFDAKSSRKIDDLILQIMPKELDIVKKKILNNTKIPNPAKYVYVISNDEKIGLNSYCRSHNIPYKKAKSITDANNLTQVEEAVLLNLLDKE